MKSRSTVITISIETDRLNSVVPDFMLFLVKSGILQGEWGRGLGLYILTTVLILFRRRLSSANESIPPRLLT